ncbi:helix-turn-helix domain protein [Secundilactobacillus silagincola]|uniref:Helix-turn-helix domain protein n=1 Tax=Secundilactobacillus silagincola TaxID=1714681 RepID=A0A1Z5J378_9LACO|nr:helix-turn-helix domain protein [Secundilactobacillus silagincola]
MLLTYKVEIKPTEKQAWQIDCHIGGSRWAYNLFLDINRQRYEQGYHYMGAYEFSKWFNHEYLEANPDDMWIRELYAKSVKQAFIDADTAMKRFFKKQSGSPIGGRLSAVRAVITLLRMVKHKSLLANVIVLSYPSLVGCG